MVNDQVKVFLSTFSVLSPYESGFMPMHSTILAVTLVVKNIVTTMDKKIHCAAVFIDLSNTFDSVIQSLLSQKLCIIRFDSTACRWFQNCLWGRNHSVNVENIQSEFFISNQRCSARISPRISFIYPSSHLSSVKALSPT